ncbi:thiamine phosphate synthase [Gelidibacter gilvus]|uniref:Thiamine phosphate synthase n=1 Tax=Gelidibacter gilvus TaxID=59602 RepID=A0A4Q0XDK3_9FLAO|nr:thiamine phosphate synthase [Gelidibacter gilvus]RXJ45827.1 thiamine phosphate synthase [Gelidibacter gilvus]
MIVLIAPQKDIENETQILDQLFESGLECYHLRKPYKTAQEYVNFITEIDPKYRNRIVLHHFHELTNNFDLKGIHFEEEQRRKYIESPTRYFKNLKLFGKTISSAFHELNDLEHSDFEFDYHFLWSQFPSETQTTSERKRSDVNGIDKLIFCVSELDANTIHEIFALGYKGIVVMEDFWQSKEPLENFTNLKTVYDAIITKP